MNEKLIAVITGGSSGIGFAIAQKMIENNVEVIIIGRTESTLRKAVEQLGNKASWIKADVSNRSNVEEAVQHIIKTNGKVNYLINNAGFNKGITLEMQLQEAEEVWEQVIGVNLKGAFLMSTALKPYISRTNGRIVNISSIAAFTGGTSAGSVAYAAAKSGINGLTRALAKELSGEGITVNAIAPGVVAETNFFSGGLTTERFNYLVSQTPAGRVGNPRDIAEAVWYLVSPQSSFITGEILNVNEGWLFGR